MDQINKKWWKEGVLYQIYPRSFKDGNGDGVGDLKGILEKLDYLQDLGVTMIWLSPIYRSPNDDNGYDISDYEAIMEEFGTMKDFDLLLVGTHVREMKLIMDLVVNHTSDQHRWFQEALKSKDSPYRDYYIWKSPIDGGPPNNWKSYFGGSAWEYEKSSGEYYLHLFSKKQPDLNWENEKLRQDIYKMMRFWLDKGVDGFRMDVIPLISKQPEFPSYNLEEIPGGLSGAYSFGPRMHEYLQEMNKEVLSKYDMVSVGEGVGVVSENALSIVGEDRNELNMVFHFDHMHMGRDDQDKFVTVEWELPEFKKIFREWDQALGNSGWGAIYLGNHDSPRMISKYGHSEGFKLASAKLLATLLFTMRGTPCIYNGDEIGMTNLKFSDINSYKDIESLNYYQEKIEEGEEPQELLERLYHQSRDNARTPMQWSPFKHGGFSDAAETWIKVNPNFSRINVEQSQKDQRSILQYYKKLIELRKTLPTLVYGGYEDIYPQDKEIHAFIRHDDDYKLLVVLNFADRILRFHLPGPIKEYPWKPIMRNYFEPLIQPSLGEWVLKPYEAGIYVLD